MHTDTDRMKWLNYFVQGEDHVVIEMVDREKKEFELLLARGVGGELAFYRGGSVHDAIDQAMAEFPMPAV